MRRALKIPQPKIAPGAGFALLIGFAPAALLGIPGLIGLAGAVVVGLGCVALLKLKQCGRFEQCCGCDATGHRGLLLFGRAGGLELRLRRSAVWRHGAGRTAASSRASIRKLAHDLGLAGLALRASRYGRHCKVPPTSRRCAVLGCSFLIPWDWPRASTRTATIWMRSGALGFSHIELGTVTPRPQPGNPKPRMFRIPGSCALINRMGFNNKGVDHLVARLARSRYRGIRGISIGKNFDTPHRECPGRLCRLPAQGLPACGLRRRECLLAQYGAPARTAGAATACSAFLARLLEERRALAGSALRRRVPLLVKVAPDLNAEQILRARAGICARWQLDGVIATNTSTDLSVLRPPPAAAQRGGLSGAPLHPASVRVIAQLRAELGAELSDYRRRRHRERGHAPARACVRARICCRSIRASRTGARRCSRKFCRRCRHDRR